MKTHLNFINTHWTKSRNGAREELAGIVTEENGKTIKAARGVQNLTRTQLEFGGKEAKI